MKKIIAANTLSQLVGRALSAATTLILTIFVARTYGAREYGDFVKITTYIAFFYLLADFGINAVFVQLDTRRYWKSFILLRAALATIVSVVALGIMYVLPGSATDGYSSFVKIGIALFVPTILFQGFITTANAIFQKNLRYVFSTVGIFFGSLITLSALFIHMGLLGVVAAVMAGSFATAIFGMWFAQKSVGPDSLPPSWKYGMSLFVSSLPLGLILVCNLVYFHADSIILTLLRSTVDVGVYGLAYKVFEFFLVFPTFFMNAVYPLMLKQENTRRLFFRSCIFLFVVSLGAAVVLWLTAPFLTMVKSDFASSIPVLRILSLGLPLFFVSSATMWLLIVKKQQLTLLGIYASSMIINIIGNIIFVPTHGIIAAAWMTVVGEGIVLVCNSVAIRKYL